jgi:cardiolipin synthase
MDFALVLLTPRQIYNLRTVGGRRTRSAWVLGIGLVLLGSCSTNPHVQPPENIPPILVHERALTEDAADPVLEKALEEYSAEPNARDLVDAVRRYSSAPLTSGNQVSVLVDGPQTFSAIEAELRKARHHIHVETFIFGAEGIGKQFADILVQKRREGVEVRVLYDSMGSRETPLSFFDDLRRKGIEVREYHPVNPVKNPAVWEIQNRDHRKIVIVDGQIGFTGGINIDNTYSSSSSSRPGPKRGIEDGWRDTHVRIEGPVVKQLQELFFESWNKAGAPVSVDDVHQYFRASETHGGALVTIVHNDSDSDDRSLYGTFLAGFTHASTRLWITHAYFVPNAQILKALEEAAQRGVDVRIIVPAFTDSTIVLKGTQATYTELLKSGVHIYELKDALLHAKTVTIDGTVSIVGSANLDMRSFVHNDEDNAIIVSRDFATRMEQVFQHDQQTSRAVDLARWEERSVWQRIKEFSVKMFGYWI